MRRLTRWSAVSLVLAALTWSTQAAPAAPGEVKSSVPLPCRYPGGLAADGERLYVTDWREAVIHEMTPAGELGRSWPAPTLKPQGLACGDGRLFVSDDHTGWIYALNPADGVVERSFEGPGPNVVGLAFSDNGLFLMEQKSGQIYLVDSDDGTILRMFEAPNRTCGGLAFDGRYLWVSDRVKDEIYLVDPVKGTVLGIVAAPAAYPAGLAWLDGYLWNADFQTRRLYQMTVRDSQKYRLTEPRAARAEFLWGLYNYGPNEVRELSLNLAIPRSWPQQELLCKVEYSTAPTDVRLDQWGQPSARFQIDAIPAGRRELVGYHVAARISAIRYLIFPDEVGPLSDIPADLLKAYTADGPRYRLDSSYLRETVAKVVGDERNPYWIARKIFDFVIERLEYEMVGGWDVPEVVLKRGRGSCSEYTFSFIALCRAAGLPAQYEGGLVVRGDDASIDEAFHRWALVYLPNYGWVPVDANRGDAAAPADRARGFGEISNRFLITMRGGGESEHLGWDYTSFSRYRATGYCKLEEERLAFWEPLAVTTRPADAASKPVATGECRVP